MGEERYATTREYAVEAVQAALAIGPELMPTVLAARLDECRGYVDVSDECRLYIDRPALRLLQEAAQLDRYEAISALWRVVDVRRQVD